MKLCLVCNLHFPDEQETCPKDNAGLVPLAGDPLIGMVIQERYKIESLIGKGTMGVVYRANQELIGREVAVKVLHSHLAADSEALKRFHQQAKAASRLNHPHIITLYDYGVIEGNRPYLVMDLLSGPTLSHILEERTNLNAEEAAPIIKQICDALADAHKHGVIHRDVKPDNIVLEEHNNQKNWVKVVDFGIAKLVHGNEETLTRITRTGTVCGSPTYMSPEQFQGGEIDHRSDIYSLGCVLFEVLTGRVPFMSVDLVGLMAQHVAEPPPKISAARPDLDFPPALEKFVDRTLAKNPDDRPQTMEAFCDEFNTALFERQRTTRGMPVVNADVPPSAPAARAQAADIALRLPAEKAQRLSLDLDEGIKAQAQSGVKAQATTQKSARVRATVPLTVRIWALIQGLTPYALTLFLFAVLLYVVSGDSRVARLMDDRLRPLIDGLVSGTGKPVGGDPEQLYAQGKLALARSALEKQKDEGALSSKNEELLNRIYMRLAEQEAKAKHYKNAVTLLEKIPPGSSQYAKGKGLLRKYRKLLSKS